MRRDENSQQPLPLHLSEMRAQMDKADRDEARPLPQLQTAKVGYAEQVENEKRRLKALKRKTFFSQTPEYRSWQDMLTRCFDPAGKSYHNYGGRGITVCDRWRQSVSTFFIDMGRRPPGTTLDRIDNNGNYEPGNCRWATRAQQACNKRNNIWITFNGETKTITEWSRVTNIELTTLRRRVLKLGWTTDEALSTPVDTSHIPFGLRGKKR